MFLHCGLHFSRQKRGGTKVSFPKPGSMPPLDSGGKDHRYTFYLLRRDVPGSPPSKVRVFYDAELVCTDRKWVVERQGGGGGATVRFCVANKAQADAWAWLLRVRAAPFLKLWKHQTGVTSTSGSEREDAGMASSSRRARRGRRAAVTAIAGFARHTLASSVLEGIVGVTTALAHDAAYNCGVSAAPLAGVCFNTLVFVGQVFSEIRGVPDVVAALSGDMDDLCATMTGLVLPAVQNADYMDELLSRLSLLLADWEELAGALCHLLRSRRRRVEHAISSARKDKLVFVRAKLQRCKEQAHGIVQLVPVVQGRATAEAIQLRQDELAAAALDAASMPLPMLPPNVYIDWGDCASPAVVMYDAVMLDGASIQPAVGAVGMGGVGKTTTCMLVAHRVANEAFGRQRFPDGVHWVQLSQATTEADVNTRLCALATSLSRTSVEAVELDTAVRHLRGALAKKACLIVVDDVWNHRWPVIFMDALAASPSSSQLFSTRASTVGSFTGSLPIAVLVAGYSLSKGVLLAHAEPDGMPLCDRTDDCVQRCIALCGGLALALAVLGSLVRSYGWCCALKRVEAVPAELLSRPAGNRLNRYESLWACLHASQSSLDATHGAEKHFLALCVVATKESVPRSALAALWREDEPTAERIAVQLRDIALVTLSGTGKTLRLELHDLVVWYLADYRTMTRDERIAMHAAMVDEYCRLNNVSIVKQEPLGDRVVAVRKLWKLRKDGWIEDALPRLLLRGGHLAELRALMREARFTTWYLQDVDQSSMARRSKLARRRRSQATSNALSACSTPLPRRRRHVHSNPSRDSLSARQATHNVHPTMSGGSAEVEECRTRGAGGPEAARESTLSRTSLPKKNDVDPASHHGGHLGPLGRPCLPPDAVIRGDARDGASHCAGPIRRAASPAQSP